MSNIGNAFLTKRIQRFTWNQAVDGNLANNTSTPIGTLPKGSIVVGGYIYVQTDVTDADDGDDSTIAVGLTGDTTSLYAATAVSGLETGTLLSLLPGNFALDGNALSAANMAIAKDDTWILNATDVNVILTTGDDEAIDAGEIHIFIEYLMPEVNA